MRVVIVVAMLAACRKHETPVAQRAEVVALPGHAIGTPSTRGSVLAPDEGTLTIDAAHGAVGQAITARVRVAPAAGFHVNVAYPIVLALEPVAAVTLAKARLVAGNGERGDAEALDERGLVLAVTGTVATAGTYVIGGTFDYAVCDDRSCHSKHQPVKIDLAAN